jgi:hypothetical protein
MSMMPNVPAFVIDVATGADFSTAWTVVTGLTGTLHNVFYNDGIPDATIGQVGGQAVGTTNWYACGFGIRETSAGDFLFLVRGRGISPVPTSVTGISGIKHLADNLFYSLDGGQL